MPYIKVNDLELYYEEYGQGEPILFLHSHFNRGITAFEGQIKVFSENYRCIFPDFRGHGKTKCESLEWTSRIIADDMASFLDSLEIKEAHLFGYSCGAYVALYIASKYPEKVKSVITVGGGTYPRPENADNYLLENLIKDGKTDFIEKMKELHFDAHRGDVETYLKMTVADWKTSPDLTEDECEKICCPCLFINGENDPFGTCSELKEKVTHALTYEVKGAGHLPHFPDERAEEVNKIVIDFLNNPIIEE